VLREEGYFYFHSWDLGLAHDATVGLVWRIPIINGRRIVSPENKARIVNSTELPGGPTLTPDAITFGVQASQQLYGGDVGLDATGMGGIMAVRSLRDMKPRPHSFVARANDRLKGNIRLAAITNALEMLAWSRPPDDAEAAGLVPGPWGLIEAPNIVELFDQLANFDRDAKDIADDWAWSFMIGCWYIRRFWVVGEFGASVPVDFAPPSRQSVVVLARRQGRRARLISPEGKLAAVPSGVRLIRPR
jgi:hypothetical protein